MRAAEDSEAELETMMIVGNSNKVGGFGGKAPGDPTALIVGSLTGSHCGRTHKICVRVYPGAFKLLGSGRYGLEFAAGRINSNSLRLVIQL